MVVTDRGAKLDDALGAERHDFVSGEAEDAGEDFVGVAAECCAGMGDAAGSQRELGYDAGLRPIGSALPG